MRAVRRRELVFVHLLLALQIGLALAYYAGGRDRLDERFAWRMFSSERMARCSLALTVGGEVVPLAARFHEGWLALVERGRLPVARAMAATLCRERPGQPVRAELRCVTLTGPRVLAQGLRDACAGGPL
jgi:hypothetical protein